MKNKIFTIFFALSCAFLFGNAKVPAQTAEKLPRVFLLNPQVLQANKRKISDAKTPDASLKTAVEKLKKDAQKALQTEIVPVTTKAAASPSGDRHD